MENLAKEHKCTLDPNLEETPKKYTSEKIINFVVEQVKEADKLTRELHETPLADLQQTNASVPSSLTVHQRLSLKNYATIFAENVLDSPPATPPLSTNDIAINIKVNKETCRFNQLVSSVAFLQNLQLILINLPLPSVVLTNRFLRIALMVILPRSNLILKNQNRKILNYNTTQKDEWMGVLKKRFARPLHKYFMS